MIATAYRGDFARENVTTFLNTSAERLVTNGGTVCGVEAVRADGSPLAINAARGIVLATGGFQANPEMRRRFQADARADTPYLGIDTCRGDGHAMAQAAGADMINMTILAPLVLVASALLEDCIAVDIHGHRFHDETGVYQDRVRALRSVDGEVAYYIFDDVTYGRKRDFVSQLPSAAVQADSIEALARTIGIAPEALAESVQRWNEFLTSGAQEDPLTGRVSLPRAGHGILQPPFHAARMVEGSDFSAGGVATTLSMQAVDVYGEPIDRLFAVGDTAGGFVPSRNLGGIHIGGALTLGRVAGRAAATGELLPSHRTRLFGHHLPGNVHTRLALVDLDTRQDTDE
jgi:succinate dehydrogenase/fumarate reductase flavoprotein subunit